MPPNGVAALHALVEPAPERSSKGDPMKPSEGIEAIGQATAAAAIVFAWGALGCHETGKVAPAAKEAGGERIAALYWLRQAHAGKIDFTATARAEGKRVLRTYFDAEFYQRHGPGAGEAMINIAIDEVLATVNRVDVMMRAWAN
jgi:hypothetical protein